MMRLLRLQQAHMERSRKIALDFLEKYLLPFSLGVA